MNDKLHNFTCAAILFALFLLMLYFGHSLLVPFVVAVVLWYLIISFVDGLVSLPYIGRFIPKFVAHLLALVIAYFILDFLITLISANIAELIVVAPKYQQRLVEIQNQLFDFFNIKQRFDFTKVFANFDIYNVVSSAAGIMADLGRKLAIILIYLLFLLLEHHSFEQKLANLIPDPKKLQSAKNMVSKITIQIRSYLKIKTLMGLLTAGTSYLVMLIVGVNFAGFWAVLIFIFNFIPNIGSIVATILPCLLTLVQFDTLIPFIIITLSLASIQFTVGNILEPRLMGKSFNLSPLAIIISLSIWGYLWGVVGMILCVPIMVIINIIFANFPGTRPISILLSETGDIDISPIE